MRYRDDYPVLPGTDARGVPLSALRRDLRGQKLSVAECERRFREKHAEWIDERYGVEEADRRYWQGRADTFGWKDNWRYVEFEHLADTFTLGELVHVWWDEVVASDLSERFARDPAYQVIHKIRSSMWRYGQWHYDDPRGHRTFLKFADAIARFDLGLPEFETRLNYTRGCNEVGWGVFGRDRDETCVYLDGVFGYQVLYRGEHVLTIGFSLSDRGVLVSQVQLKKKKGNRFLFKLPEHYLDHCLARMAETFAEFEVWLVDGASNVKALDQAHDKDGGLPREIANRVRALYDRPLAQFARCSEAYERCGRKFVRLAQRETRAA